MAAESAETSESPPSCGFPVVGIGASAGGLAALESFFSAMPADEDCGMAFVLVQHLAPDHKSILAELVQRHTSMKVVEVEDGVAIEPDRAYIIPPNRDMAFIDGTLQLLEPTAPRGLRLPIDFFFESLAQDQRERAICVVLSGTGSDGSRGIRAVSGAGGLVVVQAPATTEHDGMPRSALATGVVDLVLPPAEMPAQLIAYARHALRGGPSATPAPDAQVAGELRKICALLRRHTGHDFTQYKESTLVRRVERRMAIHQIDQPDDYVRYLQTNAEEADALFRDLLIGVTGFFRDPEVFAVLGEQVIPRIISNHEPGETIRVWCCGCSTGEEAYSLAILFHEALETRGLALGVQIFATDIDGRAIEQARSGVFPAGIAADVGADRLARHFIHDPDDDTYRVHKGIRDLLVFSEQDVTRDPPFSRLDLVSCRNLLIYLDGDLQQKLITLFHFALSPDGVLLLGTSESLGESAPLFATLDRKSKIFGRSADAPDAARPTLGGFLQPLPRRETRGQPGGKQPGAPGATSLRHVTEQTLLRHGPRAAVLVNGAGDVLHIHGRTGRFLEPAPGDATFNVLSMAREGLQRPLTTCLRRAVTHRTKEHMAGLRVATDGETITAELSVLPVDPDIAGRAAAPDLYLVVLREVLGPAPGATGGDGGGDGPDTGAADGRVAALEQELRAKEEYLQTTLEQMEAINEELRSTNEEAQSVNEELQSTNEELETSKEEMQSINEELATVNAELQIKVAELSRVNNDMNNLLAGTGVGTLFVDHQLRIARFTPATAQVINLIPSDVGRPVGHLVSNLQGYDRLVEDIERVLGDLTPIEVEVQTKAGAWYLMRIRPYRTLENVIEGVVIIFVDITDLRRAQFMLRLLARFPDQVPDPVLRIAADGTLAYANEPALQWLSAAGCAPGEPLPADLVALATAARESGGVAEAELDGGSGRRSRFAAIQPPDGDCVNVYAYDGSDGG